jgi:putative transposase
MGKLFRDKYLVESSRYKDYDCSMEGKCYVTICTKDKTHYFGEVANGTMIISKVGKITQQMLKMVTMHFPIVGLDEFV